MDVNKIYNHAYNRTLLLSLADLLNYQIFYTYTINSSEIYMNVLKITGIIMEVVENKQANSAKEDNGKLEAGGNEESILEEVDNG